ncbi:MAG: GRAM domain-containing protein [Cetobacterium sp.]
MFFQKKTEDKEIIVTKEIQKFLLDGETLEQSLGFLDNIYLTNMRVIFQESNIIAKDDVLTELVFVPLSKIDGVSYIETKNLTFNRIIKIKTRGFSHEIKFGRNNSDKATDFCKLVCKKILELEK